MQNTTYIAKKREAKKAAVVNSQRARIQRVVVTDVFRAVQTMGLGRGLQGEQISNGGVSFPNNLYFYFSAVSCT